MHLLLTRPLAQSQKTADALSARGHTCLIEPLLSVRQLPTEPPFGSFDGLVLTSTNAVEKAAAIWPEQARINLPVFTVGAATSLRAQEAGFKNCLSANGSAPDLIEPIVKWAKGHQDGNQLQLLYPCAKQVSHDMVLLLEHHAIRCVDWPVYETAEVNGFSATARDAIINNKLDGILLFSAKTARCFSQLVQELSGTISLPPLFTLSKEIALSMPTSYAEKCIVAPQPNETALLDLLDTAK